MSFTEPELARLITLFSKAEAQTYATQPSFLGGFQTISMQSYRLQHTLNRLISTHNKMKDMSAQFDVNLEDLRAQNSTRRVIKDIAMRNNIESGAMLARKRSPLTALGSNRLNIAKNKARMTPAARNSIIHQAKVEFEREDYKIRNKIDGLNALSEILEDCMAVMELRVRATKTLEKIGRKWERGELEVRDGMKLGLAQDEVIDGTMEMKEMIDMLDMLDEHLDRVSCLERM